MYSCQNATLFEIACHGSFLFCDIFSITESKMAKDQSVIEDNDLDVKCGYGKCKPSFLQRLNNPRFMLFTLCFVAISQGKF